MNLTKHHKKILRVLLTIKRLVLRGLLLLLLTLSTPCLALSSDAALPYYFKSDHLIYNNRRHQTIYIGHVHITQGTTKISGDKVIVQYGKNSRIKKMIDTGNFAHYSTLPDNHPDRLYAQAKKITYNPITKIVVLEHQGKVTQEKNVFTGPHIWYDIAAGVVRTTPRKNQQTVIVIQPQDK